MKDNYERKENRNPCDDCIHRESYDGRCRSCKHYNKARWRERG